MAEAGIEIQITRKGVVVRANAVDRAAIEIDDRAFLAAPNDADRAASDIQRAAGAQRAVAKSAAVDIHSYGVRNNQLRNSTVVFVGRTVKACAVLIHDRVRPNRGKRHIRIVSVFAGSDIQHSILADLNRVLGFHHKAI